MTMSHYDDLVADLGLDARFAQNRTLTSRAHDNCRSRRF